jgi:hypothetical protein
MLATMLVERLFSLSRKLLFSASTNVFLLTIEMKSLDVNYWMDI